jgi:3-oxoisoapionate decarboxylase
MKLAIDSYCYHRYFGEWYEGLQTDPGSRLTVWDFLAKARAFQVQGVSLESCFVPFDEPGLIAKLRQNLDHLQLERVWAWGHPHGLRSGTDNGSAADDLKRHITIARQLGATVMRICAGGRRTRVAHWADHKAGLIRQLAPLIPVARDHGVVLAIENHIDLLADEMLDLLTTLNSEWVGVCLDTANNLRMFEHPVEVAQKLAPWARATHVKDVVAQRGDPRTFAFWPSVPVGDGLVEIPQILQILRKQGYQGLLAVEIDYLHPRYPDDEAALKKSLDYLQTLLST